ncbi:hypothetical protein [Streptomyces parvus]|uniref:hypothetical protein n=1 Tax=Streptomyces parvus TaxID=66428 RepID=UPI002101572E|nr:hypothetical protein [Streptomyces parvus]MCQ1575439.1 hypothetical protein [Streptomyces parvus]
MTDTTPADRPADQLRAAAECAPGPELARLLTTLADASDHHGPGEGGVVATLVHPALAVARQLLGTSEGEEAPDEQEFGEPVCVDECGSCDVCGYEVFGTPAEGWREAARFLRRTPRDSADFSGALRGARLIEGELRRRAEAHDAAPPAPADRAAVLAEVERKMLTYALNQAQLRMWSGHGSHTEEEQAALVSLRRLAADAAAGVQPPASDTATHRASERLDLARAAVRLHRLELITTAELYAVIEAQPATPPAAPAAPEETQ